MRNHFLTAPTIWTGDTGRDWRKQGQPFQILGLYLVTSPWANQYGLYSVSREHIAVDTGLSSADIRAVLAHFAEKKFAFYDTTSQFCWVVNMARRQILTTVRALPLDDKRAIGARAWYEQMPENPFLGPFFDRYGAALGLTTRRGDPTNVVQPTLFESDEHALVVTPIIATPASPFGEEMFLAPPPIPQDELFARWYKEYPNKSGKIAARQQWAKIRPMPTEASTNAMIVVLRKQRVSHSWIKENGQFVPEPERYLKKGRWMDEKVDMPSLSDSDARTLTTLNDWTPPND